ncbi:hypothetical protein Desaci_2536 [Desulfosporosinus acidiphilus SJ4]|uniref:Uncharacterized protein n=1 Tax=Desulfosporosinus acidiphilus (strain DSM 22704 / JCM 16185 / SJ4) TaxID=646529 RepID=I4D6Q4_DESAJ|nr:hypothetical protein [Desulfosporosinus acidiphilus]AFM41478.1 hypothetical protein Desaci_2536 [Desulfosporosinus acidiphilus SJ4]
MNSLKNVAYTEEYKKYRDTFNFVFDNKYKEQVIEQPLSDGKHSARITFYKDETCSISKYRVLASKTEILNSQSQIVAKFENVNQSIFFYAFEHSNGKTYLLFKIDLYGYSIMNLSNYEVYHFVPDVSFLGQEETFIWTGAFYFNKNNILVVDGCYWACPYATLFINLTNPEQLPYKVIYSSYEMENELNIDNDIIPLRWNEDGSIVLQCSIKDDDELIERAFDVESLLAKL